MPRFVVATLASVAALGVAPAVFAAGGKPAKPARLAAAAVPKAVTTTVVPPHDKAVKIVVGDCYAEPDLRPEATALSLMMRSLIADPTIDWEAMVKDIPATTGLYADSKDAARVLTALGGEHLMTWWCSSDGVHFNATIRVSNGKGEPEAVATFHAWRGDMPSLARAIARYLAVKLRLEVDDKLVASTGSLWHVFAAQKILLRADADMAAPTLLGADVDVGTRVPAARSVTRPIWTSPTRRAGERLVVAWLTATPDEILKLCDELEHEVPAADVAAVRAMAMMRAGRWDDAGKTLTRIATDGSVLAELATAELADHFGKAPERDGLLVRLAKAHYLPALRFVAMSDPTRLGAVVESETLAAADAIRDRDPVLASAVGLHAAQHDLTVVALKLISVQYLADGDTKILAAIIAKAPESVESLRLRAELRMLVGDSAGAEADAAAAEALIRPAIDPRLALVRGRALHAQHKLAQAATELEAAGTSLTSATAELARIKQEQKDEAGARETRKALPGDITSVEQLDDAEESDDKTLDQSPAAKQARADHVMALSQENIDQLKTLAAKYADVGEATKKDQAELEAAQKSGEVMTVEPGDVALPDPKQGKKDDVAPATLDAKRPAVEQSFAWMWFIVAGFGGMLVLWLAYRFLRQGGGLNVKFKTDPTTTNRLYNCRISMFAAPPQVRNAAKFAKKTRMQGVRLGRTSSTMVGATADFTPSPGTWHIQVWGVHTKDGKEVAVESVTQRVVVARNWKTMAEIAIGDAGAECHVSCSDAKGALRGVEIWLDDKSQDLVASNAVGIAVLELRQGSYVLHARFGGATKDQNIVARRGERVDVQLKF